MLSNVNDLSGAWPLFAAGVRLSLRRFARWVEQGRPVSAR